MNQFSYPLNENRAQQQQPSNLQSTQQPQQKINAGIFGSNTNRQKSAMTTPNTLQNMSQFSSFSLNANLNQRTNQMGNPLKSMPTHQFPGMQQEHPQIQQPPPHNVNAQLANLNQNFNSRSGKC